LVGEVSFKAEDMFSLAGRKALVTGASRGIAAAIAEALAANGALVGINYSARVDNDGGFADAAASLHGRIRAGGGTAHLLEQDLLEDGSARALATKAADVLGGCDILVLGASAQVHVGLLDMTAADTRRQLQLNLLSTIDLLQALVPAMKARRHGRVLTIGSVQEAAPSPEMPIYAATKAAQASLVQSLSVELAPFGVTVNNLAPGLVETDRNAFRRENPDAWARSADMANPMHRAGRPRDLAGAALFLCSDAAAFVTGATLFVTGGAHIPQPGYGSEPQRQLAS
jgi:NAD(P)-dependent dehydrogenase (short-subunit alcohol dehydrogenase family)